MQNETNENQNKKLLIVTTVASTLRAFLLPYARHFRTLGWKVDALARDACESPECVETFNACHDIAFTRKPWELRNVRELCRKIRELVTHEHYDIVHVHTPVAAFVTRLALRKLREQGPRIVYTAHGFHFFKGGKLLRNAAFFTLERLAAHWTDHLIVINQEDYDAALDHAFMPPNHLTLLPGIGIDLSHWNRDALGFNTDEQVKAIRDELGLAPDDKLFLMVAEFNPGKHHRDAINALSMTGRRDFHLAFAGRGPLETEMRNLVNKLGLTGQVHFLGQRSDVPALIMTSLAMVLPSEREGLNRSVMESIALGVPVLGADARGIRDLVTPERGVLFPVGNPAALAAAMLMRVTEPACVALHPEPDPAWNLDDLIKAHEEIYARLLCHAQN